MDRFDLHWPKIDATFFTDGVRCRIVWRQRSGLGGNIDNNVLCKKRLADSLALEPQLLKHLEARGHQALAREIENLAGDVAVGTASRRESSGAQTSAPPPRGETPGQRLSFWLAELAGEPAWESCTARRGSGWVKVGELGNSILELRPPAARGKPEWVLKRSWPATRRKAEFVVAGHLTGIFASLQQASGLDLALLHQLAAACGELEHEEARQAAASARRVLGAEA